MKIQSVRGFKDILPGEIETWQTVEAVARTVFELYGYSEIRTPVLEKVELFSRSVGEDTDIVQKEMYVFENKREGNMAMRPEGTASVVRAYNEHTLYTTHPVPEKLYYILPMFRHERPQAGRFRQFHQIGAEALGIDSPAIDAEIIAMVFKLLQKLNVSSIEIQLNSVGCKQCRPGYREKLQKYLRDAASGLCTDCRNRLERNPMRVLDCKNETCQGIIVSAPVMLEHGCQECHEHFSELQEFLKILEVPFTINPRIVRGLDYYVRTAFEFISFSLGAQNALLGGGRYDGLSEDIGGPPLPGVGFAMGIERLLSLIQLRAEIRSPEVFIAILGPSARKPGISLQKDLRHGGIRTEVEYQERSLKSQMKKAGKLGVSYVIMIGEDELQKGTVILRNMAESSQHEVAVTDIVNTLVNVLRKKNT